MDKDNTRWLFEDVDCDPLDDPPGTAKLASFRSSGTRHIGCPIGFLADVRRFALGEIALTVALCIYRRTRVEKSRTVTLPSDDLAVLGIGRNRKREALTKLQAAGLIKVETSSGQTAVITLLWQPH